MLGLRRCVIVVGDQCLITWVVDDIKFVINRSLLANLFHFVQISILLFIPHGLDRYGLAQKHGKRFVSIVIQVRIGWLRENLIEAILCWVCFNFFVPAFKGIFDLLRCI